ncbi:hypothetical protein PEC301937_07030 [Pectobacterium carotovorum subsp. carotovorum]|nr:hypothetical protein PEC301937_07030 [Pectobacterium carotovorum subsp. carotovorum]
MANLPEQKEWIDGIYQLETSDPVIGGPGGISNRQAEQLAKRTAYLKEQQEKTGADLVSHTKAADPHTQYAPKLSPALIGTPTAPTAAAGVNNAQIATTAYVMAAIAALVNGSPGALDTLKELATALGNDPNFSTTILNKLAQKLEKEQNGADIPDKAKFMANVGLKSAATRAVGSGASDVPDITVCDGRYLGKTATAAAATKLAAARNIAGVAFDGTDDITLTPANVGALPIVGGTLSGNLVSTVADVLRMVYGGYGAILRQDGAGFYILLTNKDAASGAFNSLRPIRIDLATGNIEFGHTANASVLQEKGQRVYSPNNKPSAADIGALPADGTAAAATKLSMARKIAGVAFDGTADITLTPANVGALSAAGTAAAATKLVVARKIAGVAFDGTTDIALTADSVGAVSINTQQTITGQKTHTENIKFLRSAFPGIVMENSGVALGTIGREVSILHESASLLRIYIRNGQNTDDQQLINIPLTGTGSVLVSNVNAITDANGAWVTPGSSGSISVKEFAGIPVPFPGAVAPTGWLKCNGQSFDKALYPILASRYPSGALPDLRGEFVRGWDDGRGVDTSRALLSAQSHSIQGHAHGYRDRYMAEIESGVSNAEYREVAPDNYNQKSGTNGADYDNNMFVYIDGTTATTGGNETRPRNIAFNYIVRAA